MGLSTAATGDPSVAQKRALNDERLALAEELREAKVELVVEATQGKIDKATTYQSTAEDFQNPANLSKEENLEPELNDTDAPKTPQEKVNADFAGELETLRSYQNPENEDKYHEYYNSAELRTKYGRTLANYEDMLQESEEKIDIWVKRANTYGETGSGIGKEESDHLMYRVRKEDERVAQLKKKINYLKFLFAPENEMSHFCEYNDKNQKIKDWEKNHQMEIVEDKDYGTIDVFHNGESVSNLGYMDKFKSVPMQALNQRGMVFIYDTGKKEGNAIEYYEKEDGGLMQKTENSGTRELFKIDRSKMVMK